MAFRKPDPDTIELTRQLDSASNKFQLLSEELFGLHEQFDGRWRNAEQLAELKRLARQAESLAGEFRQQSQRPDPQAAHHLAAYGRAAGLAAVALISPLLVGMGEQIGSDLYQRWFDPTAAAAEAATDAAAQLESFANLYLSQLADPSEPLAETSREDEATPANPDWTKSDESLTEFGPEEIRPLANLSNRNLSGSDLAGRDLREANLNGTSLIGSDLSNIDLTDATLIQADLTEAILTEALLQRANLNLANLTQTDLRASNLSKASLLQATLTGADLSSADLFEAKLTKAILSGAKLTDAHLAGADLTMTDLSGAQLSGTDLSGAFASEARLAGATMVEADLSEAKLVGSDLSEADLSGANLSGTNLREAQFDKTILSAVKWNPANPPRWPDGIDPPTNSWDPMSED